jgi:hypothetical protein
MRLTQLGIPVKSIEVPEVDACAVAEVKAVPNVETVPLVAGKVNTVLPATAGAWSVQVPLVSPEITTLLILLSPIIL